MRGFRWMIAVLLAPAVAYASQDASVCIKVTCATDKIEATDGTWCKVTASKGTKVLTGPASEFIFPKNSTAQTAVDHFATQLIAAGFVEGTDFIRAGNCLQFKGVDDGKTGVDHDVGSVSQFLVTHKLTGEASVNASAPGIDLGIDAATSAAALTYGGEIRLVATGVVFEGGAVSRLSTEHTYCPTFAGDTPAAIIARLYTRLSAEGWGVSLPTPTRLHVATTRDGTGVVAANFSYRNEDQMLPHPDETGSIPHERALHWNARVYPAIPPTALGYAPATRVGTVGVTFAPMVPTSTGGTVDAYTIAPALPGGLSIDPTTGVISGTPTSAHASFNYTVTAVNLRGQSTTTVNIQVVGGP